jgi:hypothetical protein
MEGGSSRAVHRLLGIHLRTPSNTRNVGVWSLDPLSRLWLGIAIGLILDELVQKSSCISPQAIKLSQPFDLLQLALCRGPDFDVGIFHRGAGAGMGHDGAEFQNVLCGFEVGQKLVGVEFDVVDFGAGVVFFDQLADPEAVEFRPIIWGGGRWASRAWGFRRAGAVPPRTRCRACWLHRLPSHCSRRSELGARSQSP